MKLTKELIRKMAGGSRTSASGGSGGGGGGGTASYATEAGHAQSAYTLDDDSPMYNRFLRKDQEDTASGKIIFENGLTSNGSSLFNEVVTFVKKVTMNVSAWLKQGFTVGAGEQYGMNAQGALTTGTISAGGDVSVAGSVSATQNVGATGSVTAGSNVQATGNVNAGGDANITGTMTAAQVIASLLKTPAFTEMVGMIGLGFGVTTRANGKATLQTDDLYVLGKMFVNSLNIREVTYIGGTYLLTPAGSTVAKVQQLYSTGAASNTSLWTADGTGAVVGYRLLWKADDGSTGTMNYWKQGDQAFCQTFNITQPGHYENFRNQYYWRLVCRVGQVTIDGAQWHYADLSTTPTVYLYDQDGNIIHNVAGGTAFVGYEDAPQEDGGTVPMEGDKVVCLGSQADTSRQGAIQLTAEGTSSIGIYDGINNYAPLTTHEIHFFSKDAVRMSSRRFSWTTANGTSVPPSVYRGTWTTGCVSGYGDEWTYQDSMWICILASGTTTEAPGTTAANWMENKGAKGQPGTQYQRMYRSTNSGTAPTTLPSSYTDGSNNWYINPTTISASVRYRYMTERHSTDGGTTWTSWSPAVVESYLSEDGTSIDVTGTAKGIISGSQTPGDVVPQPVTGDIVLDNTSYPSGNLYTYNGTTWTTSSVAAGKGYVMDGTGHLWVSTGTNVGGGKWTDVGQFKGDQGDAGYSVMASPSSVILSESLNTQNAFSLPQYVTFTVQGDTSVTVAGVTIVSQSNISVSSYGTTQARITEVGTGNPTQGYFVCRVTTSDGRTNDVKVLVAINWQGTIKTTIEGSVETTVAQAVHTAIEEGDFVEQSTLAEYVRSDDEAYTTMQTTVNGHTTSISNLSQTSEAIKMQVRTFDNLLYNREFLPSPIDTNQNYLPDGWTRNYYNIYADRALGTVHAGRVVNLNTGVSYFLQQQIWGSDIALKRLVPGQAHTLSFYALATSTTDKIRLSFYGSSLYENIESAIKVNDTDATMSAIGTTERYIDITPTTVNQYARYVVQITVKAALSSNSGAGYIRFATTGGNIKLNMPSMAAGKATGIDIKNGIVDVMANDFVIRNSRGEKNMEVDEEGNAEFRGVIKSSNFFHSCCYFMEGGHYADDDGEQYAHCELAPDDDLVVTYGFVPGQYYSLSEVVEMTEGYYSDWPTGFILCTGKADIINMIPKTSNWQGDRTVKLPRPEDFPGKTLTVYPFAYGTTVRQVYVGCIRNGAMTTGIIYWNGTEMVLSTTQTEDTVTINTGENVTFRSVKTGTGAGTYYWKKMNV